MHRNKIIQILVLTSLILSSCIKPYVPEISIADSEKYVVTGQVTKGDSAQIVNVSRTSSIGEPQYIPVEGCVVKILDDEGNEFLLTDLKDGDYSTAIDQGFLSSGAAFMVDVLLPSGDRIISGYDTIMECPIVDSIYYIREDIEGTESGEFMLGIQFYLDLYGTPSDSRFYRWEIIETYERHADYPLEWYYDGEVQHVDPPDYSRKVCWNTVEVPEIFTLSTNNLIENSYIKFPIHYVNNRSERLMHGYSLLVRQIALSKLAYDFYDQLRINNDQEGGLYETQPLSIRGNMLNLTHPEVEVLGFFSAATMKSKRIFISNVPDLPLDFTTYCSPGSIRFPFYEFTPNEYPIYLLGDAGTWYPVQLNEECINCLMMGGTTVKPDFWPN